MATRKRAWSVSDELYDEVKKAAIRATGREGEVVTVSEWVRRAVEEKLEREKRSKRGD